MEVLQHLEEAHRLMEIVEHNNSPDHRDYGRFLMQKAKIHLDMAAVHEMIEQWDESQPEVDSTTVGH